MPSSVLVAGPQGLCAQRHHRMQHQSRRSHRRHRRQVRIQRQVTQYGSPYLHHRRRRWRRRAVISQYLQGSQFSSLTTQFTRLLCMVIFTSRTDIELTSARDSRGRNNMCRADVACSRLHCNSCMFVQQRMQQQHHIMRALICGFQISMHSVPSVIIVLDASFIFLVVAMLD